VEGYIFDRHSAATLQDSAIRLYPKNSDTKVTIPYADIAGLAFTGRDTAAGKSWEAWVKKYWERKQAGETSIAIEPDSLEEADSPHAAHSAPSSS